MLVYLHPQHIADINMVHFLQQREVTLIGQVERIMKELGQQIQMVVE